MIKLFFILSIWADARSDAIIDDTHKRHHWLEFIQIGALIAAMVVVWYFYVPLSSILAYILLRMGMFNLIYNKKRKLPYYHLGSSKYDKLLMFFQKTELRHDLPIVKGVPLLVFWYMICLFFGLWI